MTAADTTGIHNTTQQFGSSIVESVPDCGKWYTSAGGLCSQELVGVLVLECSARDRVGGQRRILLLVSWLLLCCVACKTKTVVKNLTCYFFQLRKISGDWKIPGKKTQDYKNTCRKKKQTWNRPLVQITASFELCSTTSQKEEMTWS